MAADAPSRLPGAHGEYADHAIAGRPLAGQRPDEEVGAVARADQQHRLRLRAGVRPAAAVVDAGGHARQAEQHGERQRVDDRKGRVGRVLGPEREQPAPEQRRPAHRGDGDAEEVGQSGVAPVLLRQPHRQPGEEHAATAPGRAPNHHAWSGQGAAASSIAAGSASRGQHRVEREVEQDAVGRSAAGHAGGFRTVGPRGPAAVAAPSGPPLGVVRCVGTGQFGFPAMCASGNGASPR